MKTALAITLILAAGAAAAEKPKIDKKEYMESRAVEASGSCQRYLHNNAKDPESLSFNGRVEYGRQKWSELGDFGLHGEGRGRNSYGAIRRAHWTCFVECPPHAECHVKKATMRTY